MVSTYSTNLRVDLQGTGNNTGSWGAVANSGVFALLDDAIAGTENITMTDANYTLSTTNGGDDESRAMVLNVIGTTTAVRDINLPAYAKVYIVRNNLGSGTDDIRMAIGGTYVNIPYGYTKLVHTDGTSVFDATNKAVQRWFDESGSLTTAGSSGAYTLTTNQTLTAYADGIRLHFVANHASVGSGTDALNVDSVGAKDLRKVTGSGDVALAANDIVANGHYIVQYDASADSATGAWIVLNPFVNYDSSNVAITGGSITGITDLAIADGGTAASDAATAATNLGLGTGDSPQFSTIELGHAIDTTLARVSAGVVSVEGDTIATLTATQELDNKTLDSSVAKGTWTASGTWTVPAMTTAGAITLGAAIAGADNEISRINLKDYGEVTNALGTVGASPNIDLTNGNVVTATVAGTAPTFIFSNPTASDEGCAFTLHLTNGATSVVIWPTSVDWAGGNAPDLTTTGVDILEFFTVDGGTTWYGFAAGLDMQ